VGEGLVNGGKPTGLVEGDDERGPLIVGKEEAVPDIGGRFVQLLGGRVLAAGRRVPGTV
jgi:hypothetical protein